MPQKIRTRFAPSPTGPLHMGGVRTALFNYLYAKKNNGDFLLRIEDTDQNRYVQGAEEYIIEALQWCGIQIDEGVSAGGTHAPYRQSERKEMGTYQKYALKLVNSGNAYYAFDSPEEIEAMRLKLTGEGHVAPQYNYATRLTMNNSLTLGKEEFESNLESGKPFVIRLKVNPDEEIIFTDLIRGEVIFSSNQVDDKVLMKSDGMPTYHLAHIVDDVMMEISHAIRGEEWLPSAPAHQLIYQYLGLLDKMPQYAHLPLLLKPDGNGKLSKRDGDRLGFPIFPLSWTDPKTGEVSSGYREKGYYPDAFVNMLALLGWNPGTEQEIFNMSELIDAFSFEHVHKSGARFDPDKTKWFNEQYLRNQSIGSLAERLRLTVLDTLKYQASDRRLNVDYLESVVKLLQERVQFEHEMLETGKYLFESPEDYETQVISKKYKPELLPFFESLAIAFSKLPDFNIAEIEATIKSTATELKIKPGEIMQLLRVVISGSGSGVDLIGMIHLLGAEETSERIRKGIQYLSQNKPG